MEEGESGCRNEPSLASDGLRRELVSLNFLEQNSNMLIVVQVGRNLCPNISGSRRKRVAMGQQLGMKSITGVAQ